MNPLYLRSAQVVHRESERLGATNYTELYRGFQYPARRSRRPVPPLPRLDRAACGRTQATVSSGAGSGSGSASSSAGTSRASAAASTGTPVFPKDKMVPALESTLADLGVDLRSQQNVELDLEDRPSKSPRAFCVPIEIPDRVVLVIKPQGGPDDWRALFHEAGHTEHFAHTSASLTVEERRLGDNAVTEGWAMLLEHLTIEPVWLERRLDFPRPHEFAAEGATQLLWLLRRYCAKLLYEVEFHAVPDVTAMRPRYVELLGGALKVTPSDTDYLADIDEGFYASQYLRAWAFEAQLRAFLREKFGNAWFTRKDAGSLSASCGRRARSRPRTRSSHEVTGATLELEAVADRIRTALAAVRYDRNWLTLRSPALLYLRPRDPAPRQRPDPRLPVRHGRPHRRQRARLVLGAVEAGRRRARVPRRLLPVRRHGPCLAGVHALPWYEGVFTGMFMHASWEHIVGNMLFLWIFGNNVEEALGRVRFLVWYLAGGPGGDGRADGGDALARQRARREHPEHRRERRDRGRARRLLRAPPPRPRADGDLLRDHPHPRDPRALVPARLVRPPGLVGRARAGHAAVGRRHRLLRPHRRLRLRAGHRPPRRARRPQAPSSRFPVY